MCYLLEHYGMGTDETCDCFKNAADVAEVVRCKDCESGETMCDGLLFACKKDPWASAARGDHFCSYGKRKDGAE